jgi:hypothetical protein
MRTGLHGLLSPHINRRALTRRRRPSDLHKSGDLTRAGVACLRATAEPSDRDAALQMIVAALVL